MERNLSNTSFTKKKCRKDIKFSAELLPVHCSTPKKTSNNSTSESVADSSRVSSNDMSQSEHANFFDASSLVEEDVQDVLKLQAWKLTSVIQYNGCTEECAKQVHGLNEYEILHAHSQLASLTNHEKNIWLLNYFSLQCPCNSNGEKDMKNMSYVIHGKEVCFDLWIEILSLSTSRYYRVRKEFLANNGVSYTIKPSRHQQPKTLKAIAWMDSYFQRVGDKRPDKEWVYLPTCLTKSKLYEIMTEELYQHDTSKGISYAKFCQIFNEDFKNVSIPKVASYVHSYICSVLSS